MPINRRVRVIGSVLVVLVLSDDMALAPPIHWIIFFVVGVIGLGPLVRLVKASLLLTPPPPICGIIESSQQSGLILVEWSNIMLLLKIMASIINITT